MNGGGAATPPLENPHKCDSGQSCRRQGLSAGGHIRVGCIRLYMRA